MKKRSRGAGVGGVKESELAGQRVGSGRCGRMSRWLDPALSRVLKAAGLGCRGESDPEAALRSSSNNCAQPKVPIEASPY